MMNGVSNDDADVDVDEDSLEFVGCGDVDGEQENQTDLCNEPRAGDARETSRQPKYIC